MRELIEQTKLAVPVFTYFVNASAVNPITLQVDGALGSDVITVTGAGVVGTDETVLYAADNSTAIQFVAATPRISFDYPVRLAITKPTTTAAVGLMELTTRSSAGLIRKLTMLDGLVMHDALRMM
jgi:hypothetical protein